MQRHGISKNLQDSTNSTNFGNTLITLTEQQKTQKVNIEKEKTVCLQQEPKNKIKENITNAVIITYIPVQIIQTVENNQTRTCKYLLFHLPFTLMLCDTLQVLKKQTKLYLFDILKEQIQIINRLSKRKPAQMTESQCMKVIMDAFNLPNAPQGYYLKELASFLQKNSAKMSTFIPYYYYLFQLVSKRQQYIRQETTVLEVSSIMQEKIRWIREKFHNFDIQ